jgi:hypothetical protein
MENEQIKDITKLWVEEYYNLRVTTTRVENPALSNKWRNFTN